MTAAAKKAEIFYVTNRDVVDATLTNMKALGFPYADVDADGHASLSKVEGSFFMGLIQKAPGCIPIFVLGLEYRATESHDQRHDPIDLLRGLVIVLDAERLLADPRLVVHHETLPKA